MGTLDALVDLHGWIPAFGDFCRIQPGLGMTGRIPSAPRFNEGWIPAFAGMTKVYARGSLRGNDGLGVAHGRRVGFDRHRWLLVYADRW